MPTTYHVPGLVITEREHQVPLVRDDPAGPTITVSLQHGPQYQGSLYPTPA